MLTDIEVWVFLNVKVIASQHDFNIFTIKKILESDYVKILEHNVGKNLEDSLSSQFADDHNEYNKSEIITFKKISLEELEILKSFHKFKPYRSWYTSHYNKDIIEIILKYILHSETFKLLNNISAIYAKSSNTNHQKFGRAFECMYEQIIFDDFYNETIDNPKLKEIYNFLAEWKKTLDILKYFYFDKSKTIEYNIYQLIGNYLDGYIWISISLDPELNAELKKDVTKHIRHFDDIKSIEFTVDIFPQAETYGTISLTRLIAIEHPNLTPVINYMKKWNLEQIDML